MLCNKLNLQFVKDTDMPIQVVQSPYFEYFLDLYDKDFQAKNKYRDFCNSVIHAGGEDKYINMYYDIIEKVKEDILSNPAYIKFNTEKLDQYDVKDFVEKQTLYREENDGKVFLSIDLTKANFQALRYIDKSIVNNAETYEEFISKYTEIEHIKKSKHFRQKLFGYLNGKRIRKIQKYIISKISKRLLEHNFNIENITSTSSDEIVLELTEVTNKEMMVLDDIQYYCKNNGFTVNISIFKLRKISEYKDFFVKEILYTNGEKKTVEYKGIPDLFFAQVYKMYNGLALDEKDKMFYYEHEIAFFKDFIELNLNK